MSPAEATPQVLVASVCRIRQLPEHVLCTSLGMILIAIYALPPGGSDSRASYNA